MRKEVIRKGLVLGIIVLFVGAGVVSGTGRNNSKGENRDQIDQQNSTWNGAGLGVLPPNKLAQSFKPTLNTLTRVELIVMKYGTYSPGVLRISIRSSLNGDDLTSTSIPADSATQSGGWIELDFPDITVTPEQTYYILFHADDLWVSENNLLWGKSSGDPYNRGEQWEYNGNTGVWSIIPPDPYVWDFCFKTYGQDGGNQPPGAPTITGPTNGTLWYSYSYSFNSVDPDDDPVYYYVDWGDGNVEDWVGPFSSGETVDISHSWSSQGVYEIRAKAKDVPGNESEWSDIHTMTITLNTTEVILVGLITNLYEYDDFYTFNASMLLWLCLDPFDIKFYSSGEGIAILKEYNGILFEPIIVGRFDAVLMP